MSYKLNGCKLDFLFIFCSNSDCFYKIINSYTALNKFYAQMAKPKQPLNETDQHNHK